MIQKNREEVKEGTTADQGDDITKYVELIMNI